MVKILQEKRFYPRIKKTNLILALSGKTYTDLVDLSEGGLSFNCPEDITESITYLTIYLPDKDFELKANARIIWKKNLSEDCFLYGGEFLNLKQRQKEILREELIEDQVNKLLNEVESEEVKFKISYFFLNTVLEYMNEIVKLMPFLSPPNEYSLELEKRLEQLNIKILLKGYCLQEILSDKAIIQKVKENFRNLLGVWIYKSAILKQAFDKPRGYSGDYKIHEIIYDNKPISQNMGVYFDNIFLKSPYAVGVRLRKDTFRELLQEAIQEIESDRIYILNISCGSCREIRELLPELKKQMPLSDSRTSVNFSCLDGDKQALEFSHWLLSHNPHRNIRFKFVQEDIIDIIKNRASLKSYGKQNIIYSIGLIDYLPDKILKKLIKSLYQLLGEGGKLILTHKNREKTIPLIHPDWFCDWKFIPRNKDEVIKLFYTSGISGFSPHVTSDNFGYIFYFILTKLSPTSKAF